MAKPICVDHINFKPSLKDSAVDFATEVAKAGAFLELDIRATHSGHLMSDRVYSGVGMKRGYKSWFAKENGGDAEVGRPIIKNHVASEDPLGRVYKANYVALKTGKDWELDYVNPDSGEGKYGSGYTMLISHIKDKDAIEKFADGRFVQVSTFQIPSDAWCSICGGSFMDGPDKCEEHEIGKIYPSGDSNSGSGLCYFITGTMRGVECSVVNTPRQPNAKVIAIRQLKAMDSDDYAVISESSVDSTDLNILCVKDGVSVDLSKELPSTSLITGRIKVFMQDTGEVKNKSVIIKALEDAPTKVKYEKKDYALLNTFRLVKDSFVATIDEMAEYCYGITEKADGHAHVYSVRCAVDSGSGKTYVSGNTMEIGQNGGKKVTYHGHSIWMEKASVSEVAGTHKTRSASYGPDHIHDFSYGSSDSIVVSGKDAAKAYAFVKDNIDEFEKAFKDNLIVVDGADSSAIDTDSVKLLLPFLMDEKLVDVVSKLLNKKLEETKDEDMIKQDLFEKALKELLDSKDAVAKELAAAKAVIEAKDKELSALSDAVKRAKIDSIIEAKIQKDSTISDKKEDEVKNLSVKSDEELNVIFKDALASLVVAKETAKKVNLPVASDAVVLNEDASKEAPKKKEEKPLASAKPKASLKDSDNKTGELKDPKSIARDLLSGIKK